MKYEWIFYFSCGENPSITLLRYFKPRDRPSYLFSGTSRFPWNIQYWSFDQIVDFSVITAGTLVVSKRLKTEVNHIEDSKQKTKSTPKR